MPVWFETGITQSMAWTLLAPHIVSCPAENPRIAWQNFPALNVTVSFGIGFSLHGAQNIVLPLEQSRRDASV